MTEAELHRQEWLEERSALLEYEAGYPRDMAEQTAREQWDELRAAKAKEAGQ